MIIRDENGNTWDTEYWGSEAAARKAQESCSGCSDCSDCAVCLDCSRCSRCSRCSGCSDCSGCLDCSRCSPAKTNLTIPIIADIHKKVYEAASACDALDMSSFHKCATVHCRAGWVVHLAGKEGYALEAATSPEFAAMQIYKASGYEISPSRFFENNERAMADMKRLAEV